MTSPLQKSIEIWEQKLLATDPSEIQLGPHNCPLCQVFRTESHCTGCPIRSQTGRHGCVATPYNLVVDALYDWSKEPDSEHYRQQFIHCATQELEFLKSLEDPS